MSIKRWYQGFAACRELSAFHIAVVRTMLIQLCLLCITTAVSVFVSRALGPEGRGATSWLINFTMGGAVFIALGMGAASKKHLAHHAGQMHSFSIINALLLGAMICVALPILFWWGHTLPVAKAHPIEFYIAIATIPILAGSNIITEMLIGIGKTLHANALMITERLGNASMNIGVLLMHFTSPLAIMFTYGAALAARLLLALRFMRPHVTHLPNKKELRDALRISRSLLVNGYISNIATWYSTLFLTLVLGTLSSTRELGYFAVAKLIIDSLLGLVWSIHSFAVPQLAKQRTVENYTRMKRHIIALMSIIMLLMAIPLFFYADLIIKTLFGQHFEAAAQCLSIMVIGLVANGIFSVMNAIIVSQSKEYMFVFGPITTALCMSMLVLIFSKNLTAASAAYIYNIAYILGLAVASVLVAYARFVPTQTKEEAA